MPPTIAPTMDPGAMARMNWALVRITEKVSSRLWRAKPVSIVGTETSSDRLPASLMSMPRLE